MSQIVTKEHKKNAGQFKNLMATYADAEDLINIGAYKSGSNEEIDLAIAKHKAVNEFLVQETDEKRTYEEAVNMIKEIVTT